MMSGSRVRATCPIAPSPIFIRVPVVSVRPTLWLATTTSSAAAWSKMASSPWLTLRSATARSSAAWRRLASSRRAERSAIVARSASSSAARCCAAASSRARPIAIPAWSAAAVTISKSAAPNASERLLSTTSTPTSWSFTRRGTSTSEPSLRVGR